MKRLLRKIKRILDKIFGSVIDEIYWKVYYFFKKEEVGIDPNHSHRNILIEEISKYYSFESVMEIGCGFGPNLYNLSLKFKDAKFYGIDISGKAIKEGKRFFKNKKIDNVFLEKRSADNLKKYKDKSFDIVFTDATIIYVGLDKIDSVIKEFIRIAKKAVILCEQHTEEKSFYDDKWVHNYKTILIKHISKEKITIKKLPKESWTGDWAKYGNVIEIKLQI